MNKESTYASICSVPQQTRTEQFNKCLDKTGNSGLLSLSSDDMDFDDVIYACERTVERMYCGSRVRYTKLSLSLAEFDPLTRTAKAPELLKLWTRGE